jgi:flavodoxin
MKRKRVTLIVAVKIRTQCEAMLKNAYENIKSASDYNNAEKLINKVIKQLDVLKPAIQKANERKYGFFGLFGKSNQQTIFDLTIANKKKSIIVNQCKDQSKLKQKINALDVTIKALENQRDLFNQNRKVWIKIDTELGLI